MHQDQTMKSFLQNVKASCTGSFGMKDDFDAFPEPFLKQLLTESKIIFTNEVECEIIEKLFGLNTITELFKIGKADIIVTTLGKDGSICYVRKTEKYGKKRLEFVKWNR